MLRHCEFPTSASSNLSCETAQYYRLFKTVELSLSRGFNRDGSREILVPPGKFSSDFPINSILEEGMGHNRTDR